jgi:hypothetical protein
VRTDYYHGQELEHRGFLVAEIGPGYWGCGEVTWVRGGGLPGCRYVSWERTGRSCEELVNYINEKLGVE